MRIHRLSTPTGMQRLGVQMIAIPPGKESFIPHAHSLEEEFVFVIGGMGEVVLDGVAHPIGAGDFIGFPTDGVVHSVRAVGSEDLVYLTGGERSRVEVADMPSIGKTAVFRNNAVAMHGETSTERLTMAQWFERMRIDR